MASASLTPRFAGLEIDAVPDAPRDVIPEKEKEEVTAIGSSSSIVKLHSSSEEVTITELPKEDEALLTTDLRSALPTSKSSPESLKNKRSSGRHSSGQKMDFGSQLSHLGVQLPFGLPSGGPGGGNLVFVKDSTGVQVGNVFMYNPTTVTSPVATPTSMKYNPSPKYKKIDAEEKCLEELRKVEDRVTIEEISAISTHVGVNWRTLGRRLKYTDGQLDQFYLNFEKLHIKEVVYQMLLDWKRSKTSKATVKSLAKHLYKSSEVDAMMELHKIKFSGS